MDESNFKPFGACLAALLKRHELSAAALSRMLGHKSRTTLRRILLDQANIESMEKFLSEFLSARILPLTAEEEESLHHALRISRFGLKEYLTRAEMNKLLTTPLYTTAPRTIALHNVQTDRLIHLHDLLPHFSGARSIRLLIINSPPVAFFETLSRFVPAFKDGQLEIEHYLFLNDDLSRTVRFIAAMLPLLGASCCSAYVIPLSSLGRPPLHTLTSALAICRIESENGHITECQLGFTDSDTAELLPLPDGNGAYLFWKTMLAPSLPYCVPIRSIGSRPLSISSYLDMTRTYQELEKNHAIYMIRSGLFPAFLPPDLLSDSLRENCLSDATLSKEQSDRIFDEFQAVEEKRFENIFRKKRVTHVLMSPQSLYAFARTGELRASFMPIRKFTVAERRRILIHLRNQSRDNPYFNIYFPRNDSTQIVLDATCYDPIGVLFYHTARITDPCHFPHYVDALIQLSDFTQLFVRYFRDVLLPHYALSVNASVSIINAIIDSLPPDETE